MTPEFILVLLHHSVIFQKRLLERTVRKWVVRAWTRVETERMKIKVTDNSLEGYQPDQMPRGEGKIDLKMLRL